MLAVSIDNINGGRTDVTNLSPTLDFGIYRHIKCWKLRGLKSSLVLTLVF